MPDLPNEKATPRMRAAQSIRRSLKRVPLWDWTSRNMLHDTGKATWCGLNAHFLKSSIYMQSFSPKQNLHVNIIIITREPWNEHAWLGNLPELIYALKVNYLPQIKQELTIHQKWVQPKYEINPCTALISLFINMTAELLSQNSHFAVPSASCKLPDISQIPAQTTSRNKITVRPFSTCMPKTATKTKVTERILTFTIEASTTDLKYKARTSTQSRSNAWQISCICNNALKSSTLSCGYNSYKGNELPIGRPLSSLFYLSAPRFFFTACLQHPSLYVAHNLRYLPLFLSLKIIQVFLVRPSTPINCNGHRISHAQFTDRYYPQSLSVNSSFRFKRFRDHTSTCDFNNQLVIYKLTRWQNQCNMDRNHNRKPCCQEVNTQIPRDKKP